MRITDNRPVTGKTSASKPKGSSGGSAFASHLDEGDAPNKAAAASPLASVAGMLALQEMGDALESRKKAIQKGNSLLDRLENIRRDLLFGGVPQDRLSNLKRMVEQQRETLVDPLLNSILDDIDLRVRVELAKFGQY